jgi:hypothetical protein
VMATPDDAERKFLAEEAAKGVERDGDYAEWQGRVRLEIQLAVRSTSGRPKHTDPEQQALLMRDFVADELRDRIEDRLREVYGEELDVSIGTVTLTGYPDEKWQTWDLPEDLGG